LLVGVTLVAEAQPLYQGYPYAGAPPAAPPPSNWFYDPYTSGLGPCPQRRPVDPPCRETIDPSWGQPSFWPRNP